MMQDSEKALRDQVRQSWTGIDDGCGDAGSSFETTWQAAQARHSAGRRRYRRFAGAAAFVAAVVVALYAQPPARDSYIEVADLLESTYWTAPSDALLPDRQFDIYQDMPVIFESTEPARGALL
jgi:hypothetical protein